MKTIITSILLVSFLFSATAQENTSLTPQRKPKSKIRTVGLILLGAGIGTFAGGITLGVETGGFSYEYSNTNGEVTESGEPINGVAGIITGVAIIPTVCGIIFTSIGQNSINRQKQYSIDVRPNGINLCYKF